MVVTVGLLLVFFASVIVVLYASYRKDKTFDGYAVGGRSFSGVYIAMSYTNSWWPGATFIAYFGLSAGAGLLGWYALLYSLLGLGAMYLMANLAWSWGKRHNLYTQPDLLGLRFNSPRLKVLASLIGVIASFPWIVLGMQGMGEIVRFATFGKVDVTAALLIGVGIIALRQVWTVQMGMRGLVISDMWQGIVAYGGSAIVCVGLLIFQFDGLQAINSLPGSYFELPGFDSPQGGLYFMGLVLSGTIGSLCWPASFQRIYTADSIRSVKWGTVLTFPMSGIFYMLLTLVAMSAASMDLITENPQQGWFTVLQHAGGIWLLGFGLVIVLAASMGFIDGWIQVCGTQIANDIVGTIRPLTDRQRIIVSKISMLGFLGLGVAVAYFTFDYGNLISFAQIAYAVVIQLAVPLFGGLFWKRGTAAAATTGLIVGFIISVVLTSMYAADGGAIPWLEGLPGGLVALVVNAVLYVVISLARPSSAAERLRLVQLYDDSKERLTEPPELPVHV